MDRVWVSCLGVGVIAITAFGTLSKRDSFEKGALHREVTEPDRDTMAVDVRHRSLLGLSRDRQRPLVGIPVHGDESVILSPYNRQGAPIEVAGLKPGTEVGCPSTGRVFTVPKLLRILQRKVYEVPHDFLSLDARRGESTSAQQILHLRGIDIPAEGGVSYDPVTSSLTVTASQLEHELVDAFIESIQPGFVKQVEVIVKFVEIRAEGQETLDEPDEA